MWVPKEFVVGSKGTHALHWKGDSNIKSATAKHVWFLVKLKFCASLNFELCYN